MSRFEQLREELIKIKQETAEREKARLAAEKEAGKQRALQLAQEQAKERQIEENWKIVKSQILALFRELNEKVLDSEGKIVSWQVRRQSHLHESEYDTIDRDGTWHVHYYEKCDVSAEVAELRIRNRGKLAAVRINQRHVSSNTGGCGRREVLNWPKERMDLNLPELNNPISDCYSSTPKGKWGNWVFLGYTEKENEVICVEGTPLPINGKLPKDLGEKLAEIFSKHLKYLFS